MARAIGSDWRRGLATSPMLRMVPLPRFAVASRGRKAAGLFPASRRREAGPASKCRPGRAQRITQRVENAATPRQVSRQVGLGLDAVADARHRGDGGVEVRIESDVVCNDTAATE